MSMSKIAKLAMLLLAVAPLAAPLRAQDAERRDDSVEASARERTLRLMEHVRAAEARAKSDGIVLDSREAWESVLT